MNTKTDQFRKYLLSPERKEMHQLYYDNDIEQGMKNPLPVEDRLNRPHVIDVHNFNAMLENK